MTPGARIAAAIDLLDQIQAGQPAEQALTRWARSSRFAGSGDRAAIRDYVYDALRHWRSDACRGGGVSGRARMIGRLRDQGDDIAALFDGVGHAPPPLSPEEMAAGHPPATEGDVWDLPDWLVDAFKASLDPQAEPTAQALTERAPVTLRVNTTKTDRATVQAQLKAEGVETTNNPRADTALSITQGPRRLRNAPSYLNGLVELQDGSSQAAMAGIDGTGTALDFCAGGGGKSLALAVAGWRVTAHDIEAGRMRDLPNRAQRGGHQIAICPPEEIGTAGLFDLVLCDAPCSGAGTWRRAPEAKWALTPDRLQTLMAMQVQVLDAAVAHVGQGGRLIYATCSVLKEENEQQVDAFLSRHSGWRLAHVQTWPVDAWGDGFFVAHLGRG
ncbi:RsmB/NOP family class I SAM-dependent RNA methyltransferase [uncultured Tateyamaria sp.]|uniref:RsmB/NOP family class I SAM-dependent RNA methyltransferase n=1 Tax=uncultured Tateyamaria sp. TaxID=455651 RepID=UPI002632C2C6|nr:RsmB/NOP family class I SAM-dependent RNA methyltransferase [uncultured Tateyamaria sp.]